MSQTTIQLTQQGGISLPKYIGQNYDWQSGETFVLLEFQDEFILCLQSAVIPVIIDYIEHHVSQNDEPLETKLSKILRQPALSSISLSQVMDYISQKAASRGLSSEIYELIWKISVSHPGRAGISGIAG